jgi:hypothetical protein
VRRAPTTATPHPTRVPTTRTARQSTGAILLLPIQFVRTTHRVGFGVHSTRLLPAVIGASTPRRLGGRAASDVARAWLVGIAIAAVTACTKQQPFYSASGVRVLPYQVDRSDRAISVHCTIVNKGKQPIVVDLDAWSLRLASGEVLEPASTAARHRLYTIQPGSTQNVFVPFATPNAELAHRTTSSTLIVAGVRFSRGAKPYVVEEVELATGPFDRYSYVIDPSADPNPVDGGR